MSSEESDPDNGDGLPSTERPGTVAGGLDRVGPHYPAEGPRRRPSEDPSRTVAHGSRRRLSASRIPAEQWRTSKILKTSIVLNSSRCWRTQEPEHRYPLYFLHSHTPKCATEFQTCGYANQLYQDLHTAIFLHLDPLPQHTDSYDPTSVQIVIATAASRFPKMLAEKSDPSRPNVVAPPSR